MSKSRARASPVRQATYLLGLSLTCVFTESISAACAQASRYLNFPPNFDQIWRKRGLSAVSKNAVLQYYFFPIPGFTVFTGDGEARAASKPFGSSIQRGAACLSSALRCLQPPLPTPAVVLGGASTTQPPFFATPVLCPAGARIPTTPRPTRFAFQSSADVDAFCCSVCHQVLTWEEAQSGISSAILEGFYQRGKFALCQNPVCAAQRQPHRCADVHEPTTDGCGVGAQPFQPQHVGGGTALPASN